ncbi:MAG: Zn-dependent hydrolase [Rhizobiaceae bacterium]
MNDTIEQLDLRAAVRDQRQFAADLFDSYFDISKDVEGVTRPGWSEIEEAGAQLVADRSRTLGLELEFDELGQVYATLPGVDRSTPRIVIASHLDSVQRGGNFDGYAGVVAGMTALAALKTKGVTPSCDLTVMGTRGEESVWYGIAYIGSRYSVGDLSWEELSTLVRADTGKSLPDHLEDLGYDVETAMARAGTARLTAENTLAYFELHIEQGPLLDRAGITAAVPTAIRGNARYPEITCTGRYGHASAEPLEERRDAVLAVAELINRFDAYWKDQIAAGAPDTQLTVGRIHTDIYQDGLTVVPGECRFSFNFGGTTQAFIDDGKAHFAQLLDEIAVSRKVEFDIGRQVGSAPVPLDAGLRATLRASAEALGISYHEMATVGHDAAIYAKAGIPAAMILVRNQNGSHNPREAMDIDDFLESTAILMQAVLRVA